MPVKSVLLAAHLNVLRVLSGGLGGITGLSKDVHFDLLDPTKLIPEELVPVRRIGKMTLNRNPDNFFAETEQVAFHTGNIVPGQQAVFEVRQRHREKKDLLLLVATYWRLGTKPTSLDPKILDDRMGHACDLETSMMLRLAPHLVGDYKKIKPVGFGESFDPAGRGWITQEHSPAGHVGDPREASAEKGERLFNAFTDDAVKFLERVIAWDGSSWSG